MGTIFSAHHYIKYSHWSIDYLNYLCLLKNKFNLSKTFSVVIECWICKLCGGRGGGTDQYLFNGAPKCVYRFLIKGLSVGWYLNLNIWRVGLNVARVQSPIKLFINLIQSHLTSVQWKYFNLKMFSRVWKCESIQHIWSESLSYWMSMKIWF